jgi:NitT/TauT family transport system substrate-binding protein
VLRVRLSCIHMKHIMDNGRRQWLVEAGAGASALGLALAWPALTIHAAELRPVTVALTARNSLYHLPLVLADRLGYFRLQGLQVNLMAHESGASGVAGVLQGRADVLAGAFEHLFELQRKGHFFQGFVQMNATPMVSLGVAVGKAAQGQWQDLRGARIGVSALESGTHWMASLWLLRHGLQPQDVHFVDVGTSATALGALWEGQVDALCNPDPVMHWLEQRGEIRLLAEARTPSGTLQLAGGALPGGCLMAREEFLLRQPQVAMALAEGVVQALRWLQTAGVTDLFKMVPVAPWVSDRSVYLGALDRLRDAYARDGQFQEEAVFNAWHLHARVASASSVARQQLARTYTNAFTARAHARGV